jgi:hypothetical protein
VLLGGDYLRFPLETGGRPEADRLLHLTGGREWPCQGRHPAPDYRVPVVPNRRFGGCHLDPVTVTWSRDRSHGLRQVQASDVGLKTSASGTAKVQRNRPLRQRNKSDPCPLSRSVDIAVEFVISGRRFHKSCTT